LAIVARYELEVAVVQRLDQTQGQHFRVAPTGRLGQVGEPRRTGEAARGAGWEGRREGQQERLGAIDVGRPERPLEGVLL